VKFKKPLKCPGYRLDPGNRMASQTAPAKPSTTPLLPLANSKAQEASLAAVTTKEERPRKKGRRLYTRETNSSPNPCQLSARGRPFQELGSHPSQDTMKDCASTGTSPRSIEQIRTPTRRIRSRRIFFSCHVVFLGSRMPADFFLASTGS